MTIVGGVYRELCRLPTNTDETWGSGGRAAAVVAGLGVKATLHTAVDNQTAGLLNSLAYTFHFTTVQTDISTALQFHYDHALSSPRIWPSERLGEKIRQLRVEAENALVFGMLEAKADICAKCVVYDPQNPRSPEPFIAAPGSSPRTAYVLNNSEASKFAQVEEPAKAARKIANRHCAEVVVIKRGPWGALIYDKGHLQQISAYKTDRVWPIGSGDIFAAVFAVGWACEGMPAAKAAWRASRAAAIYVSTQVLPIQSQTIKSGKKFPFSPLELRGKPLRKGEYHIYLAGPFFNIAQRWLIEESRNALQGMGLKVFSPLHEVGVGSAHDVAPQDINALKSSRAVLAVVDGLDAGTIFEIGCARSLKKPVVALAESTAEEPLKMITGTACDVQSDFVTAVYRAAWAALA
jgi:nucleoside 2-deoxyribosyltransferase/hydroxymethylpyrimidine/phosphomethylpyrimidine kinase